MHPALIVGQVFDWMRALAIDCKLIPRTWRRLARSCRFIPDIGPDMGCLGLFVSRGQHLQRGIIRQQCCTVLHPFGNGPSQWFQKSGGLPHPVRLLTVSYQRRVVLPSLHLGNPVHTFHARFPQISVERPIAGSVHLMKKLLRIRRSARQLDHLFSYSKI